MQNNHIIHIIRLGRLLTGVSYFFLLPILPILLMKAPYNFTTAQASWALGLLAFASGGFTIFFTPLVRRVGDRLSILIGYGLSGVLLALLIFIHSYGAVLLLLLCYGLLQSLAMLGSRMMVSTLPDEDRLTGFSQMFAWFNAGCVIGQVIVLFLPFRELFYVPIVLASVLQVISAFPHLRLSTRYIGAAKEGLQSLRELTKFARSEWPSMKIASFFLFLCASSYYLLMQQSELIVVFIEYDFFASPELGFALAMNPVLIMTLQSRFSRWFKKLEAQQFGRSFIISFWFYAAAYFCLAAWWNPNIVWLVVLLIACGEMLITPHIDYYLSRLCSKRSLPYVLSLTPLSFALGRSVCAFWGIRYLGAAETHSWPLEWWWYGQVAFSVALVLLVWMCAGRVARVKV